MASYAVHNIISKLDNGEFVFIKCRDDSEEFLHKDNGRYLVSTNSTFSNVSHTFMSAELLAEHIDGLRGYGNYKPDDYDYDYEYDANLSSGKCGCGE